MALWGGGSLYLYHGEVVGALGPWREERGGVEAKQGMQQLRYFKMPNSSVNILIWGVFRSLLGNMRRKPATAMVCQCSRVLYENEAVWLKWKKAMLMHHPSAGMWKRDPSGRAKVKMDALDRLRNGRILQGLCWWSDEQDGLRVAGPGWHWHTVPYQ